MENDPLWGRSAHRILFASLLGSNTLEQNRHTQRETTKMKRSLFATALTCVFLLQMSAGEKQVFSEETGGNGKFSKIGTCDWSIKMPHSAESFRFAKQTGLRGIQYSFGVKGEGLDLRTRQNRDKVRAIVKETGVAISSMGIGLLNKVPLATTEDADQLVMECLESMIKLKEEAAELADRELAAKVSPQIVLLAFFGKADINGSPERMKVVIEKLKRFAPIAEKHGFVLGLETLLNETDHRHLMESVGSPAVKVYYDTANSARMGYDIYSEIESLGSDNICEIHIKENGGLIGKGDIDFDRVKSLLKKIDYQGWLILEGSVPKGMSRTEASEKNAAIVFDLFRS